MPLIFFGYGLTNDTEVVLTSLHGEFGSRCSKTHEFSVRTPSFHILANEDGTSAQVEITAGDLPSIEGEQTFYVCLRTSGHGTPFIHQGSMPELSVKVYNLLLPIWVMVCFIIVLLCLSGLFSGKF